MKSSALVSLKTYTTRSMEVFSQALGELNVDCDIEKGSSVYKVQRRAESFQSFRNIMGEEVFEGYALVVKLKTDLGPRELLQLASHIESAAAKHSSRRAVSLNVLVYDSLIAQRPDMTLPHPELHLRPEELVPAAEIWSEYEHPVLKETLAQLAKPHLRGAWGEYFSSAERLLDF